MSIGQCDRCGGWHTQATACPALQPSTSEVKYYAVVMQNDYDALAARLAEAEALLREAQSQLRDQPRGSTLDDRIDAFLARENERG